MSIASTSKGQDIGERAAQWWREFCEPLNGDPATRSRLRRAGSTNEALSITGAIALARRLGTLGRESPESDRRVELAIGLSRVLSHVTADSPDTAMRIAGWKSFPRETKGGGEGEERPRLSETRFRRLLMAEEGEEKVTSFIRLVDLLGGTVNIRALAQDFWWWNDRTRRRWAFDYYAASSAAPANSQSPEDPDA